MGRERVHQWAELLKAVAHPVRLTMLAEMADGPKCVNHIRELLAVRQPSVSQHLTILRHSGLVAFYQDGSRRCYYLAKPALVKALFGFLQADYPVAKPSRRAALRAVRGSRAGPASTGRGRSKPPR